jgi:hypothetical protein
MLGLGAMFGHAVSLRYVAFDATDLAENFIDRFLKTYQPQKLSIIVQDEGTKGL